MLASENVETVVLDNFSAQFQKTAKGATVIKGDICDEKLLESTLRGITHVWHGAYPHNIASRVDDIETVWKNIRATTTLATIARQNKVKKFVYASSRSVYGNARYNPVDEKHPVQPVTAYGLCKAVCEEKLRDILGESLTKLCTLRGFLVYGPGDRQSVVTKFAQTILKGDNPKIFGDGSATRDFIHVEDMARATVLAMKLENATGVYNVGSGKETSLLQLVKLFGEVTGRKDITPQFIHTDAWNVNDRCFADTTLATRVLGFKPSISLKEGICQVIQDYESRTGN
jgi:UDP-glucose 4-epimerase